MSIALQCFSQNLCTPCYLYIGYNYAEKKPAHHVCTHITSRQIEFATKPVQPGLSSSIRLEVMWVQTWCANFSSLPNFVRGVIHLFICVHPLILSDSYMHSDLHSYMHSYYHFYMHTHSWTFCMHVSLNAWRQRIENESAYREWRRRFWTDVVVVDDVKSCRVDDVSDQWLLLCPARLVGFFSHHRAW